jgi:hypothetical protein
MGTGPPSDPYVPSPVCATSAGAIAEPEAPSRDEIEAFAGANGPVYWDLLRASTVSHSLFIGFNVAAAAFPYAWLAYRKLYRECALAALASAVLGALVEAVPYLKPHIGSLLFTYLISSAAIGILGNGLLLRRIRIAAAQVRRQESDPGRRLRLLSRQGGTSWFAPVVVVLVFSLVRISLRNWIQP